jgi:hypothetical protein
VSRRDVGSQLTVAQVRFAPFSDPRNQFRLEQIFSSEFAIPTAVERPDPQLPRKLARPWTGLLRHYRDPLGAWSGIVNGSSLESTTKTASKLADSLSLAFSQIL